MRRPPEKVDPNMRAGKRLEISPDELFEPTPLGEPVDWVCLLCGHVSKSEDGHGHPVKNPKDGRIAKALFLNGTLDKLCWEMRNEKMTFDQCKGYFMVIGMTENGASVFAKALRRPREAAPKRQVTPR